jgi:hypothetical protein
MLRPKDFKLLTEALLETDQRPLGTRAKVTRLTASGQLITDTTYIDFNISRILRKILDNSKEYEPIMRITLSTTFSTR